MFPMWRSKVKFDLLSFYILTTVYHIDAVFNLCLRGLDVFYSLCDNSMQ